MKIIHEIILKLSVLKRTEELRQNANYVTINVQVDLLELYLNSKSI